VNGSSLTNSPKPTWTWTSSGVGGSGAYRYQLDSEAGEWVGTLEQFYVPLVPLDEGNHVLYVQEYDLFGIWSKSGYFITKIDLTAPIGSSFPTLPDTGQTKCYQGVDPWAEIPCAGTGQDGEYNINPMSYTNAGDGMVKDSITGLIWQKCSVGPK